MDTTRQKNRSYIRKTVDNVKQATGAVALGTVFLLGYSGSLHGQTQPVEKSSPVVTGTFYNTTTVPEAPSAQSNQQTGKLSVNLDKVSSFQFLETDTNKFNSNGTTQYTYGLSGQYIRNDIKKDPSWVQGAVLGDYGATANSGDVTSAAADWSWRVASLFDRKLNTSILGNVGSVYRNGDKKSHDDVAGGVKFNFLGSSNIIAEYSHYATKNGSSTADGLRLGYMFNNNTNALGAFLVDKQMGEKRAYTVLIGSPHVRFIGGLDPNKNQTEKVYQTQLYVSLGKLSAYTVTGQLASVFAESRVSSGTTAGIPGSGFGVPNANNTYLASTPPIYYLTESTKGRFGDFLRVKVNQNSLTDKKPYYKDQDYGNYSLLRTGKSTGVIFGENKTLDSSGNWHTGGTVGFTGPHFAVSGTIENRHYGVFSLTFKY